MAADNLTSNRPYLLRALFDWINDNELTPHLLVDAEMQGVTVPPGTVQNGKVVLNVAPRAVNNLDLGNDWVRFQARFDGVAQSVEIPMEAVIAIYARENGQGMMFADAVADTEPEGGGQPDPDKPRPGGHLKVVK